MAETKYGKYIVDALKSDIVEAPWSPPVKPVSKGDGGTAAFSGQ